MAGDFKYFKLSEFACGCGQCQNLIKPGFVAMLDKARQIADTPFVINSGYRCPAHNAAVGGVATSSHLAGLGADIATGGNFERRFSILAGLLAAGFNRIGIANTFVHADLDTQKAPSVIWLYK